MVTFRAVRIAPSRTSADDGWAVERTEPDGFRIVVTKLFDDAHEAEAEAARLNHEASLRSMN